MLKMFKKLFKDESRKFIRSSQSIVDAVNALEERFSAMSNEELTAQTQVFKDRLAAGETVDDILTEAFAVVREAAKRTLGMRHYDVQIIGGLAIHQGNIAEMRTGEGKTLVATLPVYLNALLGRGVHVVTVNDYLARRDAVWMGELYTFLGLSVGVINTQTVSYLYDKSATLENDEERDEVSSFKVMYEFLRECSRKDAYAADITYGTNNEFGFDYLRDNLATQKEALVQRDHAFAIVDEIDSILIDEARTPLIISSAAEESGDMYKQFAQIARTLNEGEDYEKDEKLRAVTLTDAGITKAERALGLDNIYTEQGIKNVHHLETAVRAQALFAKDKEYVVREGQVIIVDQSTGRMMPGRRFNQGLHQALEAKENVQVQRESKTVASITFQNYFKFYEKLSGMTGTALTSKEEFFTVYGLDVVEIPTHRPIARIDHRDFIFASEQGKFKAIAKRVKELHTKGQPVLIGTISIEKNELLSAYLKQEGVPHEVLNAKKHEQEGQIIAQAGRKGSVVIATNMAGRGIDIKLGGDPATQESEEEIKSVGGLYVLGTERHESRRIDNQLRGRAGRQGDPGETHFYVSMEDDLMRVFGSDRAKSMMSTLGIKDDEPIENSIITKAIETAQKRIEGFHFDARKQTLEYDNVLNTQRNAVYARRRNILKGDLEMMKKELFSMYTGEVLEKLQKTVAEKEEALGADIFAQMLRRIMLYGIDTLWIEHLETMDYTRSSVNLRAYGQREPIVEYKKEGLRLYNEMNEAYKRQTMELIEKLEASAGSAPQPQSTVASTIVAGAAFNRAELDKKYGRNDKITIRKGEEEQEIKYKKLDDFIAQGWSPKIEK